MVLPQSKSSAARPVEIERFLVAPCGSAKRGYSRDRCAHAPVPRAFRPLRRSQSVLVVAVLLRPSLRIATRRSPGSDGPPSLPGGPRRSNSSERLEGELLRLKKSHPGPIGFWASPKRQGELPDRGGSRTWRERRRRSKLPPIAASAQLSRIYPVRPELELRRRSLARRSWAAS